MRDLVALFRSTLFNIALVVYVGLLCLVCLPGLFVPKKQALKVVAAFVYSVYALERLFLGLRYEVRGRENLPVGQSFIVAAKHESAYETMKLNILFYDPAIILKKELFRIPLWGRFLAKAEPIAIDRKQRKAAGAQIIEGAQRVAREGRPIVIFPQGTRVNYWTNTAEKPYKNGVARMAQATGMLVIPMALNSGLFWPRGGWIKRSGTVVFEFLPAIDGTLETDAFMTALEETLETASAALAREGAERHKLNFHEKS